MTVLLLSASKRSRFLFDWSAQSCLAAAEQSLNAITGQIATFSRASIKTAVDANGVLRTVAHSLPAFQWGTDPVSGLSVPGGLFEDARANALTYSGQLDNAAYVLQSATVSPNVITAPDGTLTADKLVEAVSVDSHNISRSVTGTASTSQSFSCFVKAAERTWVQLVFRDRAGSLKRVWVNLTTGVVGTKDAAITLTINALVNGWFRTGITCSAGIGAGTMSVYVTPSTGDAIDLYQGVASNGIYLWGFQYETDAPYPSSYIPTVAAAVTRNADVLSFVFATLPRAMTVYTKHVEAGAIIASGGVRSIVAIGDNARTAPTLTIEQNGAGNYRAIRTDLVNASQPTGAPSLGDTVELRATLSSTGVVTCGQSINGAAETVGAATPAVALPGAFSGATLWLNGINAVYEASSAIQSVRVAPGVQTLATMRAG